MKWKYIACSFIARFIEMKNSNFFFQEIYCFDFVLVLCYDIVFVF